MVIPGAQVAYIERGDHDEICLGPQSTPLHLNSVILLPGLLSRDERMLLLGAAEQSAQRSANPSAPHIRCPVLKHVVVKPMLGPVSEPGMGVEATELWSSVMRRVLIPFNSRLSPSWEGVLESQVLYAVSAEGVEEPTVNRYNIGGSFPKHQDEIEMSVLCLLDDDGFEGGGTDFWAEDASNQAIGTKYEHPTLRLHAGSIRPASAMC